MRTDREVELVSHRSTRRRPWSPAQFAAAVVGLAMTVVGGVALARLLPTSSITGESVTVAGMGFTALMGGLTVIIGLAFLVSAGRPGSARAGAITMGVAMVAFGLVVLIEPNALGGALGVNQTSGLAFLSVGAVAGIVGITAPTFVSRSSTLEHHDHKDQEIVQVD